MREVTLPPEVRPPPRGCKKSIKKGVNYTSFSEGIPQYVVFGYIKGLAEYIKCKYSTENMQKRYCSSKWEWFAFIGGREEA
ncbi:hypothetical protein [Ruminiclostridium josui]|uniref:hypothetical protein n=1 Tax=Ruminiclostridium josui TaxID=1499 RepID=UPI0004637F5C|nr:hypothetical protein [Ruminiclostridium josui]